MKFSADERKAAKGIGLVYATLVAGLIANREPVTRYQGNDFSCTIRGDKRVIEIADAHYHLVAVATTPGRIEQIPGSHPQYTLRTREVNEETAIENIKRCSAAFDAKNDDDIKRSRITLE